MGLELAETTIRYTPGLPSCENVFPGGLSANQAARKTSVDSEPQVVDSSSRRQSKERMELDHPKDKSINVN